MAGSIFDSDEVTKPIIRLPVSKTVERDKELGDHRRAKRDTIPMPFVIRIK